MYTDWKATTAADFSATEQPDNYKNYFTGKKTCCDPISKLMFKTTFTLHLAKYLQFNTGGLFGNPLAKVMTPLDKLNLQILTAQMKCYQTYAAANPSVATSSPGDSSTDAPENVKKLFEALTAEKMKISSTYRLGYAKIGLAASRLFRGTRIALCMDPDAPLTSIWESGIKVKQADLDSLTKDLAEGLVLIKTATVRSYEMFAFQAKSS